MKPRFCHSFLLALLLLLPTAAMGYDFAADGMYYQINDDAITVSVTFKTASKYKDYSGDVIIPAAVTHEGIEYPVTAIGNSAFSLCDGLTSISIPNTVTTIGYYALYGCTKLAQITLPESVTRIGSYAFEYCHSLTEMVIPNSVTSMGDAPFLGCPNLERVVLGSSVSTIGGYLFCDCSKLTSVTSLAPAPPVITTSEPYTGLLFNDMAYYNQATLHVPSGAIEAYQSAEYWNLFGQLSPIVGAMTVEMPGEATVTAGATVVLPVMLCNDAKVVGFQTDILLPEGFELVTGADGDYAISLGERASEGHTWMASKLADGRIRLLCYSATNTPLAGNEGELFNFAVKVPMTAVGDNYLIELHNTRLTLEDLTEHVVDGTVTCHLHVKPFIPGDVDGDGQVTIADANTVIIIIINGGGSSGHTRAPGEQAVIADGDVNGDGEINIADINDIIAKVLM